MKIETFDYNIEVLPALIWQYGSSPNLSDLLFQKEAWYQLFYNGFWTNWYRDIFNLQTANLFGLAVWSYILAVPLFVPVNPDPPGKPIWGFNEIVSTGPTVMKNNYVNFNRGNFSARDTTIILTPEEQRLLLKLRYYQLTSRATVTEINAFLAKLFTDPGVPYDGRAWVEDDLVMEMTYVFAFELPNRMKQLFIDLDILPRPAGVAVNIAVNP